MIAIDTNVLVRFLVGDDQEQAKSAGEFLGTLEPRDPGLVCREVMVELVWVLERTYGFRHSQIAAAVEELIDSSEIVFEDVDRVRIALHEYRSSGFDFSDLMIRSIATELGAGHVVTFDRKFAQASNVNLVD